MMQRGTMIRRDKELKRFVHASGVHGQQAVINRVKDISMRPPEAVNPALPHGLTPQSLNDYYSAEWGRYVQFVSQRGAQVPGRDVQWNMTLVWEYLRHRALTCKPETVKVKQILTKLVHFARRSF